MANDRFETAERNDEAVDGVTEIGASEVGTIAGSVVGLEIGRGGTLAVDNAD
jgi:hypothetical protein